MRQTPTFSMSRRMVQAIAQVAGRRGESMSAVVRSCRSRVYQARR